MINTQRVDKRRDRYRIRMRPGGNSAVTVSLPATDDCEETDAICTSDDRVLSESVTATVPGPTSEARVVSIAAANPVTEGTAAVFTLTRTGSLADALTVDVSVTETGAMVKGTPPATVTFDANSATAELPVETEDDEVAESHSF